MSCKLYYKQGKNDYYLGEFQNRGKAEEHWKLVKEHIKSKLGSGIEPIYVETKKGRAK